MSSQLRQRADEMIEWLMSAIGPKQTSLATHMSAFGGKADMAVCIANVCF